MILDTLITDRTAADVERVKALSQKGFAAMTAAEKAEYLQPMKGAYNATDLNRVGEACEYVANRLHQYGYAVDVQKIPHRRGGQGRLPDGYTELEYIQSSGTQYINTGYVPKTTTKVIADIDFLSGNTTYNCIFGVGQTSSNQFVVYRTNASTMTGQIYSTTTYNTSGVTITGRHTIELSNGTFKYGTFSTTFAAQSFTYSYPLAIFAMNSMGNATLHAHIRLYAFTIYEGNNIVHDYLPCKNASNVVGLWDDVEGRFYGNSGSGAFVAGPELSIDPPTNLHQVPAVVLQWSAVSGAERYNVYRDGVLVGNTTATTFVDTTIAENADYSYYVTAIGGIESDPSNVISVYTRSGYIYIAPIIETAFFQ